MISFKLAAYTETNIKTYRRSSGLLCLSLGTVPPAPPGPPLGRPTVGTGGIVVGSNFYVSFL